MIIRKRQIMFSCQWYNFIDENNDSASKMKCSLKFLKFHKNKTEWQSKYKLHSPVHSELII